MKVGAIIRNHWAGDSNPVRYFIYTGIKGRYATGIYLSDNKLTTVDYLAKDFEDRETFEVVGYCSGFSIMKADLKGFLENAIDY